MTHEHIDNVDNIDLRLSTKTVIYHFRWCIITITTVGFGDCHIQTALGKVVATAASITGIILLAFPVSLIVENFAQAQHQSLIETQIKQCEF